MTIDVNYTQHSDYLEFKVTGSFDMNDAVKKFQQVLDLCRLTKITKILIDYRELKGVDSATQKSLYAFGTEDLYLRYLKAGGQDLQIAYIAPFLLEYEPGAEIGKKVESLKLELFERLDEALEWLGIKNT